MVGSGIQALTVSLWSWKSELVTGGLKWRKWMNGAGDSIFKSVLIVNGIQW